MDNQPDWRSALHSERDDLKARNNYRELRTWEKREGKYVWREDRRFLNLSANDYLGLATDMALHQEFLAQQDRSDLIDDFGFGASASRLLTGNHRQYDLLENDLARCFRRESALVFNSGYQANLGILSALLGPQDQVFVDRLSHASLMDGIRLSGARFHRFRHLDYGHLETLLAKYGPGARHKLVVTESVFSMDGDTADLPALVRLKRRHQALLYVDEAHAFGVFGRRGLGWCEATHTIPDIDLLVGTFGKALAALGAFLTADQPFVDLLVNRMRPFIYTTALPPILVHWLRFLLARLPDLRSRLAHLATLSGQLRRELKAAGLEILGNSQIIPVLIGDNDRALQTADFLQGRGYQLMAIRPPTVPEGTARLRISLTANLDWDDVRELPGLLRKFIRATPGKGRP